MADDDGHEPSKGSSRSDGAAWTALSAASRDKADAFLDEQTILTRLQAKELAHELALRHWSMRFGNVSSVMKVSFEVAMALIVVSIAALIGGAVWSAAHDDGLVIHAFSVPPDLAARGMTGDVVAGRMLDRLSALQIQTESLRPANSYTNNWGDDIKVQIPDTGVSIGEFNRYLHQWLGHETHIFGDVVRTGGSLTVTARAGAGSAESFTGNDADIDALVQRAAEAVYADTQPYRYGAYLLEHNKIAESSAVFARDAASGDPTERAWAYVGWTNALNAENRVAEALQKARASVEQDPDFILGRYRQGAMEGALGLAESALVDNKRTLQLLDGGGAGGLRANGATLLKVGALLYIDDALGDYTDETQQIRGMEVVSSSTLRSIAESVVYNYATTLAEDHDPAGAQLVLSHARRLTSLSTNGQEGPIVAELAAQNTRGVELEIAYMSRNWRRLLDVAHAIDAHEPKLDAAFVSDFYLPTQMWPYLAYAEAEVGDFASARALIDRTPLDCDLCLRLRGKIAASEGRYDAAEFWFLRATSAAPSIPFAYTDWGEMLLHEGKYEAAIAKFKLANAKGPHFADPLEMWGEALVLQNRSDLALTKFEEANKYAPNWGRLHLEWGKALFYAGKKDDAKKQLTLAVHLDLSTVDKAALGKWATAHG
jgi:tetratricopeptide (TPR) repeat protein